MADDPEVIDRVHVDFHVRNELSKLRPMLSVEIRADVFAAALLDLRQIFITCEFAARGADDPRVLRDLTRRCAPVKRGQKLAHGQIAGAAEEGQIEIRKGLHE